MRSYISRMSSHLHLRWLKGAVGNFQNGLAVDRAQISGKDGQV